MGIAFLSCSTYFGLINIGWNFKFGLIGLRSLDAIIIIGSTIHLAQRKKLSEGTINRVAQSKLDSAIVC